MNVTFDADTLRFLHSIEGRYPYAFGYLTAHVRGFLNGDTTRDRLAAVLDALETELRGESR
jgi:hypothetical protein